MTTYIAKTVSKRIFKEHAGNKFGQGDPYFDYQPQLDRHGNPTGKSKKVKKRVPDGISAADAKILSKVTRRAYRLDNNLSFCGFRFGWSAVIGLLPFLGDGLDLFMALMVIHTAEKADLDEGVRARMIRNVIFDFAIGFVPFLGDIVDAFFRANTRNAFILYEMLEKRGMENIEAQKKLQAQQQGLQYPINNQRTRVNVEDRSDTDDLGPPPQYERSANTQHAVPPPNPARPQPARVAEERGGIGGWLTRLGSGRNDYTDLERGQTGAPPPQPPRPQR